MKPQFSRGGETGQQAFVRSQSCEPCQVNRHDACYQAKAEIGLSSRAFDCACYQQAQVGGDHDKHYGPEWGDGDW